jgi:hypothetical protein
VEDSHGRTSALARGRDRADRDQGATECQQKKTIVSAIPARRFELRRRFVSTGPVSSFQPILEVRARTD